MTRRTETDAGSWRRGPWPAVALAAVLLLAGGLAGRFLAGQNPLQRAWRAALAAGHYRVTGTTRSQTASGVAAYEVDGEGELDGVLRLRVVPVGRAAGAVGGSDAIGTVTRDNLTAGGYSDTGSGITTLDSAITSTGAISFTLAWPTVEVSPELTSSDRPSSGLGAQQSSVSTLHGAGAQQNRSGGLDPHALALIFPAGDPLALLPAAHAPAEGGLESVDGRDCRRVEFLVNGLAYVPWWLGHRQYLPVNGNAGPLEKVGGSGTLWLDPSNDRPCRVSVQLALPRLAGDQPGTGEADWSYADWGK